MPIDPRIVLGVQAPGKVQIQDPLESYGKSLALQNLMRTGDLQDLQFKAAQRGDADDEAVRAAYREGEGDNARVRALLARSGQYKAVQAHDKATLDALKARTDIEKDQAATAKTRYDMQIDAIQRGSAILSTAKDQPSWDAARRLMTVNFPQLASQLPGQYDPHFVALKVAEGQTVTQRLADERARETAAETGRHNRVTEATAAGQLGVARDRLALDRDQPRGVFDTERGVVVDLRNATARPVTLAQPAPGNPMAPGGASVMAPPAGGEQAAASQPPAQAPTQAPTVLGPKLTEAQKKELMSIDQQEKTIDGALAAVAKSPTAFSMMRGMATMAGSLPETVAGRLDTPEQRQARAYVFNVVSKVINERAGAAQSAQELARLRAFLPAEADSADQVRDKLNGFKQYLKDLRSGVRPAGGEQPAAPAAASGWTIEVVQ